MHRVNYPLYWNYNKIFCDVHNEPLYSCSVMTFRRVVIYTLWLHPGSYPYLICIPAFIYSLYNTRYIPVVYSWSAQHAEITIAHRKTDYWLATLLVILFHGNSRGFILFYTAYLKWPIKSDWSKAYWINFAIVYFWRSVQWNELSWSDFHMGNYSLT